MLECKKCWGCKEGREHKGGCKRFWGANREEVQGAVGVQRGKCASGCWGARSAGGSRGCWGARVCKGCVGVVGVQREKVCKEGSV